MKKTTRREFLHKATEVGAGALLISLFPGCRSVSIDDEGGNALRFITNVDDGSWFYFSAMDIPAGRVPQISANEWSLEVSSADKKIAEISMELLKSLADQGEERSILKTLRCIQAPYAQTETGLRTATGIFRGIPLRRVLEETSVSPEVLKFRLFGADGFTSSIPADRVNDEEKFPVILAYELNGAPIPRKFGGPVRVMVPDAWAFKCVKWIDKIDATTDFSTFGTLERGKYSGRAYIDNPGNIALMTTVKTTEGSVFSVPSDYTLEGMALVGGGRISKVEYNVDGGEFADAEIVGLKEIEEDLGFIGTLLKETEQYSTEWPYESVWVPFRIPLKLEKGVHSVTIRSSDFDKRTNLPSAVEPFQIAPSILLKLTAP